MVAPKDPKKREEWLFKLQHQTDIHKERNRISLKLFWESPEGILLKERLSKERKGKPRDPKTIEKMSLANLGKKYSAETNAKKGRKGCIGPNRGKINPDARIRMFFEKLDQRYSRRQQASDNHKGEKNPMYGKKRPEISTLMSHLAATRKFPFKNSKPERMMQLALKILGVNFTPHKVISTRKGFSHCVDIFIEPNICVEVDGKYFHTQPKQAQRDIKINHELTIGGYYIIRIWDSDILSNNISCANIVLSMIEKQIGGYVKL